MYVLLGWPQDPIFFNSLKFRSFSWQKRIRKENKISIGIIIYTSKLLFFFVAYLPDLAVDPNEKIYSTEPW